MTQSLNVMPTDTLTLIAKLQQKKNKVRYDLNTMGVQPKGGVNQFDKYKYFTEAQYKELFTDLFSQNGLELKADTIGMEEFGGTDKQPQGRRVTVEFTLYDIDTGYGETSRIIGEGLDKGDKALYKAYTGALKYYFAETFAVATGDEVEKESPELKDKPTVRELNDFALGYSEDEQRRIKANYGVKSIEEISGFAIRKYIKDRKDIIEKKRKEGDGIADKPRPFY